MTAGRALQDERRCAVAVRPWAASVVPVLPLLALWGVLVVGRGVCLVAQRVPPAVWTVRAVRELLQRRRERAELRRGP